MGLSVGDKAPDFSLNDQSGKTRSLRATKGKVLVLFFYPKDDTPGCTIEACGFRDEYSSFSKYGVNVWGVSNDSLESHKDFSEKYNLPFPLLIDNENNLRKRYEVPSILGVIPGRVTYVIDKSGEIRLIFNNLLDGKAHVRNALSLVRELSTQVN